MQTRVLSREQTPPVGGESAADVSGSRHRATRSEQLASRPLVGVVALNA